MVLIDFGQAYWARFDPHTVYFVGGFGDEHYIGYIPLQKYQGATAATHPVHLPQGQQVLRGDWRD